MHTRTGRSHGSRGFAGPARSIVLRQLDKLESGGLEVVDPWGQYLFGSETSVRLQVHSPGFYWRLLTAGSVGAGEAYADGDWDTNDLTRLLQLILANRAVLDGFDNSYTRLLRKGIDRIGYMRQANTRWGSRENIAAHYDLSNEFFSLWLDERMMYSSALYADPAMSLEEASAAKLERIASLLQLKPGDHVLEIGSGWGGLAIYLARNFGVEVTTTTISRAQYQEADRRIKAASLDDSVHLLLDDYRDLNGRFDKVVSIEMVEAVGNEFLDGYLAKVDELLKPGGRFVMQAITIRDEHFESALREVDFIKKHIFPGGFLPSVSRLTEAGAKTGSLNLLELHDLGAGYAHTLAAWARRFMAAERQLDALGFDRVFRRLWEFYFSYCRAGFLETAITNKHLVFAKRPEPFGGSQ